MSTEAGVVRARAEEMIGWVETSDALFGGRAAVISDLWGLTKSHGEAAWDGAEAAPADLGAIALAIAFVRSLTDDCTMPEVAVDPDGAVSLDWIASRHRMLSVSFSGTSNRLAYAWIDGTDRGHAVERFDGARVPKRLMESILGIAEALHRAPVRAS